jgi:hypothetical protein
VGKEVGAGGRRDFLGNEAVPGDGLIFNICHNTFVKTDTVYNTKNNYGHG